MKAPATRSRLIDRWRNDPFPLFAIACCLVGLAVVAALVLHGSAANLVGGALFVVGLLVLIASAWFAVSGYRRRTGSGRAK
jgi:hypothetical protein